jgi:hypothetical protein
MAHWRHQTRRLALTLKEMAPRLPGFWKTDRDQAIVNIELYIYQKLSEALRNIPSVQKLVVRVENDLANDKRWVFVTIYTKSSERPFVVRESLDDFPSDGLLGKILIFC